MALFLKALNGLNDLIQFRPRIAVSNTESPALAVMKPATMAKMPLVMPLSTPLGIELTNLDTAETA